MITINLSDLIEAAKTYNMTIVLTVLEETVTIGAKKQIGSQLYGDYMRMSVDSAATDLDSLASNFLDQLNSRLRGENV